MNEIDMNDLSNIAKIKSNIMHIYWQLLQENYCTKDEAAQDMIPIIADIIELENKFQIKVPSN